MTREQMIEHATRQHPGTTVRFVNGVCQSCKGTQ